ncbi:MAG: hypothetical protein ACRDNW_21215 [Trebonia sp.]
MSGDELPDEADRLDTEGSSRLSEVTAFLASAPTPALPDAVEARISAALAVEAAARAGHGGQPGAAAPTETARRHEPAPARTRVRRNRRAGGGRRALRSRSLMAAAAAVICLAFAGLGYGLSRDGGSPAVSSESAASGASAGRAAGQNKEAAGPAVPASKPTSSSAAAAGSSSGTVGGSFAVTESGTRYQAATLAAQARTQLATAPEAVTVPRPGRPSSAVGAASSVPPAGLRGCVTRLTDGLSPRLVDRATYQGKPAYIIVGSAKVWVVGLGCTAGNQELIASVPLEP